MPAYISQVNNSVGSSAVVEIKNNALFLDEVLGSLKLFTLMLSKMQPIPDSLPKIAETSYSVNDIALSPAIIARLYYNVEYGRPAEFNYDIEKLKEIYSKYGLPWDEVVLSN